MFAPGYYRAPTGAREYWWWTGSDWKRPVWVNPTSGTPWVTPEDLLPFLQEAYEAGYQEGVSSNDDYFDDDDEDS